MNRCASLLAGVAATYALTILLGLPPPSLPQLAAGGLVIAALVVLSRPAPAREPAVAADRLFLFVCSGNTCRSPMAEAIARAELAARSGRRPFVSVASAGLKVRDGMPMTPEAEVALRSLGVDPGSHRARPLTPELVARSSWPTGRLPAPSWRRRPTAAASPSMAGRCCWWRPAASSG